MSEPSRRVAIVKSAGRADEFAQAVTEAGFVPVLVSPFREERMAGQEQSFARLLRRGSTPLKGRASTGRPKWVALTSPNASWVLDTVRPWPEDVRIAAIGPGTGSCVHAAGLKTAVVGEGGGAVLARQMLAAGLAAGDVVLFPCGEETRPELSAALSDADVHVISIPVYRMIADPVGERAATGVFAAVVVGSPRLGERAMELIPPPRPPAIAIGRTTAQALRDLGWPPAAVAEKPTAKDAGAALRAVLGGR